MKWTKQLIASLPDASFAYIAPGGKKDKDGKTPDDFRDLPYKDAQGVLNVPLLREALSRLPSIEGISQEKQAAIRTQLEAELDQAMKDSQHFEVLSSTIELSEGEVTSTIELLRVGTIRDRGFVVTKQMLLDYERNFKNGAYGTDLQVNFGHYTQGEAAGWFKDVFVEGESLMGTIEWTTLGVEKIRKKLYRFISVELAGRYPTEDGKIAENVLTGAGLTNTPALKKQVPISLSEQKKTLIHNTHMFKAYIANLKKRQKLSAEDIALAKTLLNEEPAEEQEAHKAEVADLEKKQQADAAAEKAEADKKEEAMKAQNGGISLSEFRDLQESNKKLAEQLALREVSDDVQGSLILSEKQGVGFLDEEKNAVVAFMATLTAEQRTAFKGLVSKVKNVDFSTRGTTKGERVAVANGSKSYDERVAERAQAIFNEGAGKVTLREAQDKAMEEITA